MFNKSSCLKLMRVGCVPLLAAAAVHAGAAPPPPSGRLDFNAANAGAFSKVLQGDGEVVCWSAKRAILSQGYMLDKYSEGAVVTGTKDTQMDAKTSITIRLQATCVDNKDGTSTVFANAERETNRLQKVRQGWTAGVSILSVTVPTKSENVMQPVSRETITDPKFYSGFYDLVQSFAASEAPH
jgi:hypothetical protein